MTGRACHRPPIVLIQRDLYRNIKAEQTEGSGLLPIWECRFWRIASRFTPSPLKRPVALKVPEFRPNLCRAEWITSGDLARTGTLTENQPVKPMSAVYQPAIRKFHQRSSC
jgi:hypothetical protein